jgi:tRNA pseudouridine38-40 synthase
MERNFKLVIEYDGTAYYGWQRQGRVPTIQATIETAIAKMANQAVALHGSGRTDRGVHAWNQVATFSADTHLSCEAIQKGLNGLTPADIVIKHCESVPMTFHPRFHAISKIYEYVILNRSVPVAVGRQYAWHVHRPLEIDLMVKGAAVLKGTHDFAAFESTGSPRTHTVRTVFDLSIGYEPSSGRVIVTVEANGFLRCMVRNIVGTLVNVGFGKTSIEEVKDILLSKDRKRAGATAPAHGLFLKEVKY